jgi:hypothetical protein
MVADSTSSKTYQTQAQQGLHEVYGGGSYVVQAYTPNVGIGLARQNVASLDFRFATPLLMLLMLVAITLVFRRNLARFVVSFFRFRKYMVYRQAPLWNSKLFYTIIFLFSVLALALLMTELVQQVSPAFAENSAFAVLFLAFCGITAGLMLLRLAACRCIGMVANADSLFVNIAISQLLYFAIMSILVVLAFFIKSFLDESFALPVLVPLGGVLGAAVCMYVMRTVRLFLYEKSLLFFWFLYFCTVEILPLTITYKVLENMQ